MGSSLAQTSSAVGVIVKAKARSRGREVEEPALYAGLVKMSDATVLVERGKDRLVALAESINARWGSTSGIRYDVGTDDVVRVYAATPEPPPRAWATDVRDILSDLRSALDYAVFSSAIRATGEDPPPGARSLALPVELSREGFVGKAPRYLQGLSEAAVGLIESCQPYHWGDKDSGLYLLNELNNASKHRAMPVVWEGLESTKLEITKLAAMRLEDFKVMHRPGKLKDGDLLFSFRVATEVEGTPLLRLGVQTQLKLVFPTGSAAAGMPVLEVLRACHAWSSGLVARLEALPTEG